MDCWASGEGAGVGGTVAAAGSCNAWDATPGDVEAGADGVVGELASGIADAVGDGAGSAAMAAPVIPGLAISEAASSMTHSGFTAGRRD
nr:hypothetical protein [Pseudarthrobacter equi]